ncbi:MAG: multicomponent K+:H+ antiporter subunit G [Yoonia sp.]|jgi:multicomponent K+:H+ antiporter subunit G
MTFQIIATFTITISLLIGTIFTLVAGVGLIKLDTSMSRLHAPTKAGTVGIGAFLFASMIHAWTFSQGSFHELLIMGFLFVTAPVSANFMAKVNIHRGACDPLPAPTNDDTWSTLNVPEEDIEIAETDA